MTPFEVVPSIELRKVSRRVTTKQEVLSSTNISLKIDTPGNKIGL